MNTRTRRAALGVSFAACVAVAALMPQVAAAQSIDTIIVVVHNVFERNGNAPRFIARPADAAHIKTQAWAVRRALLFNQGDRYDSATVVESESALRSMNIFRMVHIDTLRVNGRLAARVTTDDGWTTTPQVGYGIANGSARWQAGVVESNVLGTATSVGAIYGRTPDRSDVAFQFSRPSLRTRHDIAMADYTNSSDGKSADWIYGVPFYESAAMNALTTDGEFADERVLEFRDGLPLASPQRRALRFTVTGGVTSYATSHGYARFLLAATFRREDFAPDSTQAFPRSTFGTVGIGFEAANTRLRVVEHLNSFARSEDVDLSSRLDLGVWAAPRAFGYAAGHDGVGLAAGVQQGAWWPGGFAVGRAAADGVLGAAGLDSGRVSVALTAVQFGLPRQTWILHAEAAALRRPKPGDEFDLWISQNGPRLFGAHNFTGTRMAWATIENRVLVRDDLWGLVGVGLAPFVDYGGAWYDGETPRLGADAGIALRLGATHGGSGNLGEYAVGYRFGPTAVGRGWAFSIQRAFIYLAPDTPKTSGAPNTFGPR